MNTEPIIFEQAGRRAVITGNSVKLLKVSTKGRSTRQVWPETKVDNCYHAGLLWVLKGSIDFGDRAI